VRENETLRKKIPMRKSEMKRRAIFIGLCYLSLAISLLLFYICRIMDGKAVFDPKIIFLVVAIIVLGAFRASRAIDRKDTAVIGVLVGSVGIPMILLWIYLTVSMFALTVMLPCQIIQTTALIVTYCKWVAK
jgi:hypothetical protein